jgi:hypothetical protein
MSRPSQRSIAVAGKSTPFAYATPHSGPFISGPGFNAYNNGGDTEPDDDNDAYDNDDGEQSWRGVTDGDNDNDSASSSVLDAETGAQEGASFSGDDSGFGSDNGEDSDAPSEDDGEVYAQRQQDEEDEDDEDVFDSLLSIIEA